MVWKDHREGTGCAMTKEVLVSIRGLQFADGQGNEPVEVITSGNYYKKNGKHYILFDEVAEGMEEPTRNVIKLGEDQFDITKRGAVNVHMMFEKGKKNVSYYYTPYGSLLIGIDAERIAVVEAEQELDVEVDYALEVNYEHVADCKIELKVKNKGAGDFWF